MGPARPVVGTGRDGRGTPSREEVFPMKTTHRWVDPFAARPAAVSVSLRIAPELLSRVKRQAGRAGVPYQTFVKGIFEAAVSRLERGSLGSRRSGPITRRRKTAKR